MLFPVALTHATEDELDQNIVCRGDFVSLCHPQAHLYLKPKYQGMLPCVLIFPAGKAAHLRKCSECCESEPSKASLELPKVTHSPRVRVWVQVVWTDAICVAQECVMRKAKLSSRQLSSWAEHLTCNETCPQIHDCTAWKSSKTVWTNLVLKSA